MSGLPVAAWTEEEWHWDIEDEAWAYAEAWDEYRKTNREKAMTPRTGCYPCTNCDVWWVGPGQRCPGCKAKAMKYRLKRESNA